MRPRSIQRVHSARVALVAAAVILAGYVVAAAVVDVLVVHRLTSQVDERLSQSLARSDRPALTLPGGARSATVQPDPDDAPVFAWHVSASGIARPLSQGAPRLPSRTWTAGTTTSFDLAGAPFRFQATRSGDGWTVVGVSVRQIDRIRADLLVSEILLGAVAAVLAYLGALTIGRRASAPVEEVRRKQAEFTADASHELRTPLSVIEAELELALGRPRDSSYYRATLERVSGESQRLRRLVNDLLWLARADARMPDRQVGTLDLLAVSEASAERFQPLAAARSIELTTQQVGDQRPLIEAPDDWIDRLVGVLIDNACRFAGEGGRVQLCVGLRGSRASLVVDDSGPGIPPEERGRIFDRFHRGVDEPGGAGLGLAIADSVVKGTGGTWSIGRAPIGGARMEVLWRPSSGAAEPGVGASQETADAGGHGAPGPEERALLDRGVLGRAMNRPTLG